MNYRVVSRLLGILLIVLSLLMATALFWTIYYSESGTTRTFVVSSLITMLAGIGLYLPGRREGGSIGRREALLVVTASWVFVGCAGGLPYLLDGAFTNPADAYFESVSGFTTTGSTVLTDVESLSNGLHYWRTLTHWLGGMGIIVLFIAIFPQLGVGAKHLFKSEVPGPITEGLKPKIRETASLLWKIYVGLTALECGLLYLAGMDLFQSICHSFATMATGGFSTKNASIAYFHSAEIDFVVTIFMFLAGVNFSIYYAIIKGRVGILLRDSELRVYLMMVLIATVVVSADILSLHGDLLKAVRYGSFQVVAIVTTTGFGTDNFDAYPSFSKLLLIALMFIGGSAGSTAGGMKVSRIMVLAKAASVEIYRVFRPRAVRSVRLGKSVIPEETTRSILGFFAIAIFVFVLGSIFMGLLGLDVISATTSVVATLFNIGPGLGRVGSLENFAFIPTAGKIFLSFCMILGRLEFYTILVLLVPDFWRR